MTEERSELKPLMMMVFLIVRSSEI